MSNLIEHAKDEFKMMGWLDKHDEMQELAMNNVLELLEVFHKQGHSGFSASYVLNVFDKLVRFNPLSPLTGDESEWAENGQNIRDSEVFRNEDGKAYWICGKIFEEEDGSRYTSTNSRVYIEFPWSKPKPEIVKV